MEVCKKPTFNKTLNLFDVLSKILKFTTKNDTISFFLNVHDK